MPDLNDRAFVRSRSGLVNNPGLIIIAACGAKETLYRYFPDDRTFYSLISTPLSSGLTFRCDLQV